MKEEEKEEEEKKKEEEKDEEKEEEKEVEEGRRRSKRRRMGTGELFCWNSQELEGGEFEAFFKVHKTLSWSLSEIYCARCRKVANMACNETML